MNRLDTGERGLLHREHQLRERVSAGGGFLQMAVVRGIPITVVVEEPRGGGQVMLMRVHRHALQGRDYPSVQNTVGAVVFPEVCCERLGFFSAASGLDQPTAQRLDVGELMEWRRIAGNVQQPSIVTWLGETPDIGRIVTIYSQATEFDILQCDERHL